jgi:hypothetical protein
MSIDQGITDVLYSESWWIEKRCQRVNNEMKKMRDTGDSGEIRFIEDCTAGLPLITVW